MALALLLVLGSAPTKADCDRPEDATAVRVTALQQEMMVAAFVCHDVAAYNRFVISHRSELQALDRTLMNFFVEQSARTGFDDYNLYKTELANSSSLRSVHDPMFCRRINADFEVAFARIGPLEELLPRIPYPVDTGSVQCGGYAIRTASTPEEAPKAQAQRVRRHRTWLGRLVDSIFD